MQQDFAHRAQEGNELLGEHLEKVEEAAKLFLSTLKGFRRDLPLSMQACPKYFDADFPGEVNTIGVPPMKTGNSFTDLRGMLEFCESAIDGTIKIKNPPMSFDASEKEKLLEEVAVAHKNLMDISDTAYGLYQFLQTACFEFDVFNSKNIEVDNIAPNIVFDRDALNVSRALSRALSERAIRLDIDLMESKKRLETGERHAKV